MQFGGVAAVASVGSSTTINATAPAHADGVVTVVVTNPDGKSASRDPGYTYEVEPVFAISGVVTEMTDEGEMPVEGVSVTESATHTPRGRTAGARIALAVSAVRPSPCR